MTGRGASQRITGEQRADLVRSIHACRAVGMSRPAIARELGIPVSRVDAILADHPWPPPGSGSDGGTTAECPSCDTEVDLTAGRLSDHGPCPGSGLPLGATP